MHHGQPPIRLSAGDIIVLPHGDTHVLSSTPGLRRTPDMSLYRMPSDGQLPISISMGDPNGEPVHFVCGFLGCDARPYNPLLTALPQVILVSGQREGHSPRMCSSPWRNRRARAWEDNACSAA